MNQHDTVDFKQKYKTLKRKLRMLVYEQECFLEELRRSQRKLLKVSRDRSYLLDRLLQYEKIDESSSDSDLTASSDSEAEVHREIAPFKRKKTTANQPDPWFLGTMTNPALASLQNLAGIKAEPPKKKSKATIKKATKATKLTVGNKMLGPAHLGSLKPIQQSLPMIKQEGGVVIQHPGGQMTREELERHLDSRQNARPQYMSVEKTPQVLPDDIFSHENSNQDGDMVVGKTEEDQELVIDMPQ